MRIKQIILKYLFLIEIFYLIAKGIEKLFWSRRDSKSMEKIRKELSNFEKLSEHSKCGLDECKRVRSLVLV